MKENQLRHTLISAAKAGARVLEQHRGRLREIRSKHDHVNVVTEADIQAEAAIMDVIAGSFPNHARMGEESGYVGGTASLTWIVDPLDGTSNYAAGLPWYGVLVAVLDEKGPLEACMTLPEEGAVYLAARGKGATKNGTSVSVSRAKALEEVLFVHATEAVGDTAFTKASMKLMSRTVERVRNLRVTNSLVDFACVADGRFGGCINHNTSIWDIAAPKLIIEEAGGRFTHLNGRPIRFDLTPEGRHEKFQVLAAPPALHQQILDISRLV